MHHERSLDLVVELLAVLMSGAAYLPLDPELPASRLAFQIEDCGARHRADHVRTSPGGSPDRRPASSPWTSCCPTLPRSPAAARARPRPMTPRTSSTPRARPAGRRAWLYRIAASSTGCCGCRRRTGCGPDDRVLQKTPFSFDVSVWEFFWPLLTGAALVVARPGRPSGPRAIWPDLIARAAASPRCTSCRRCCEVFLAEPAAGGAAPAPGDLQRRGAAAGAARAGSSRASDGAELHNLYGPTEAAVDVTAWRVHRPDAEPDRCRSAGRSPTPGLYVLDRGGEPVPIGRPGRAVHRRRPGRARLSQPARADRRALHRRPVRRSRRRLYRTGDLRRAAARTATSSTWAGSTTRSRCAASASSWARSSPRCSAHHGDGAGGRDRPRPAGRAAAAHAHVVPQAIAAATGGTAGMAAGAAARLHGAVPLRRSRRPAAAVQRQGGPQGAADARGARPAARRGRRPETAAERLVHRRLGAQVLGRRTGRRGRRRSSSWAATPSCSIRVRTAVERAGPHLRGGRPVPRTRSSASSPSSHPLERPEGPRRPRAVRAALRRGPGAAAGRAATTRYPLSSHAGRHGLPRRVRGGLVGLPRGHQRPGRGPPRPSRCGPRRRHRAPGTRLRSSFDLTGYSEPLQLVHQDVPIPLRPGGRLGGVDDDARLTCHLTEWAEAAKHPTST